MRRPDRARCSDLFGSLLAARFVAAEAAPTSCSQYQQHPPASGTATAARAAAENQYASELGFGRYAVPRLDSLGDFRVLGACQQVIGAATSGLALELDVDAAAAGNIAQETVEHLRIVGIVTTPLARRCSVRITRAAEKAGPIPEEINRRIRRDIRAVISNRHPELGRLAGLDAAFVASIFNDDRQVRHVDCGRSTT